MDKSKKEVGVMPKVETKVKTDEDYGKQFCVLMNVDRELTELVNNNIAKELNRYAFVAIKSFPSKDIEALNEALFSVRGEIMSLMAFAYGKARVKEEEMKN